MHHVQGSVALYMKGLKVGAVYDLQLDKGCLLSKQ